MIPTIAKEGEIYRSYLGKTTIRVISIDRSSPFEERPYCEVIETTAVGGKLGQKFWCGHGMQGYRRVEGGH